MCSIKQMEWSILDKDNNFLKKVNCQYDALDLAVMVYNATKIEIDFTEKKAKILEKQNETNK